MSKGSIIALSVVGSVVLFIIISICWICGIYNGEVRIANRYDAQSNVVETTLDTMRKDLMNKFKVTKQFAEDFIKVATVQSGGRSGGTLMKSTRESESLGISPELYKSMLASIEGRLNEFKRSQDTLTDVWREHKTYCQTMPNSFFVGGKVKPKPEMISSDTAKEIIKTKRQDDNLLEQK